MSPAIYNWYAGFYDIMEGMFRRRLAAAIAAMPIRPGDQLLDVGVGTGFSLSHFPAHLHVTAVDLSVPMLRRAESKIAQLRPDCPPKQTRFLHADALGLPFADRSFDLVFLSHVISTVADPQRCLAEALRVARDHSHIMLVNHFQSDAWFLRSLELAIDPLCRKLGWRTSLSLRDLLEPFNVHGIPAKGAIFQTVLLQKSPHGIRVVPAANAARAAIRAPWRPAFRRAPA